MDGRPPLVRGFNQGISFYEAETFLNPTNTEGGVNEKWNILISFVSRFFKVVHSRRLQSIFFLRIREYLAITEAIMDFLFSYYL